MLRIVAALLVLISHCYPLTGSQYEPFSQLGGYDTGGGWGVTVFFVISGFLVTRSIIGRTAGEYLKSRALRIIPALLLVTIFEVLVIGPAFTSLSLSQYFSHPLTISHLFNGSIFWLNAWLPGVFEDTPGKAVNGSLWTLPVECSFYLVLPLLAAIGLLRRQAFAALPVLVAGVLLFGTYQWGWAWDNQGGTLFSSVPTYSATKSALLFLIGGGLWIYRDSIPMNPGLALCCLLLLIISGFQETRQAVFFITVPYLTIYLALAHPVHIPAYEKMGDLSYGTYVFAFPVQQSVFAVWGPSMSPMKMALISVPITLLLAALSWHFVERRALRLRKKRVVDLPRSDGRGPVLEPVEVGLESRTAFEQTELQAPADLRSDIHVRRAEPVSGDVLGR
jgi:peptidoglycan/LPS O-acetylase OafA/YrhL